MEKVDLKLLAIINQIISDLSDRSNHYLVLANYYFYYGKLTNFAPVYFNNDAIEDIQLTEDGLICKLVFYKKDTDDRFTIRIPYNQIGKITKCEDSEFIREHTLFLNEEVMLRYNYTPKDYLV